MLYRFKMGINKKLSTITKIEKNTYTFFKMKCLWLFSSSNLKLEQLLFKKNIHSRPV